MYPYSRLDSARKEIRLLRLWSRQECLQHASTHVHCSILTVSLFKPPPYDALSYTCSREGATKSIVIDGQTLRVTESVQCALRRLQRDSESYVIWVDAISINQGDASEKGWQVAHMGEVYRQAERVLVWLGEEADNSDAAMEAIALIGKDASDLIGMRDDELELVAERCARSLPSDLDMYDDGSPEVLYHWTIGTLDNDWKFPLRGLIALIRRPWWRRLWVLQELVLARDVLFLCGAKWVLESHIMGAWAMFDVVQRAISRRVSNQPEAVSDYERKFVSAMVDNAVRDMLLRRRRMGQCYEGSSLLPLYALLRLTLMGSNGQDAPSLAVTDPRDRIFALLGMASDGASLDIRPSYRSSCRETYTLATICLLKEGHLSLLELNQFPKRFTVLPSWVPDWSCTVTESLQIYEDDWHIARAPAFRAAGTTPPSLEFLKTGPSEMILAITGVRVDTVKHIGMTWQEHLLQEKSESDIIEKGMSWLEKLFGLCTKRRWTSRFINRNIDGPEYGSEEQWRVAMLLVSAGGQITEPENDEPRKMLKDDARAVMEAMNNFASGVDPILLEYMINVQERAYNRRIFLTSGGLLGLGSAQVKKKDLVAVFNGSGMPYLLRPFGDARYQLLGETYVGGIMEGEIMYGDPEFEQFCLV